MGKLLNRFSHGPSKKRLDLIDFGGNPDVSVRFTVTVGLALELRLFFNITRKTVLLLGLTESYSETPGMF